jgi:VanZ family protein
MPLPYGLRLFAIPSLGARMSDRQHTSPEFIDIMKVSTAQCKFSAPSVERPARLTYASRMIRIATLCLAVYWLAIFVATHLPSSSMPSLKFSDKIQHACAYAGLGFLMAWAFPSGQILRERARHAIMVVLLVSCYGVIDELTQRFIPGRTCDFWDAVADAVGAVIGVSVYCGLRAFLVRRAWGQKLIDRFSVSVSIQRSSS